MKICFLINKDLNPNTFAFIYPILINLNNFKKLSIDIKFDISNKNYDLIFLDSKYLIKHFLKKEEVQIEGIFKDLKKKTNYLVYCDNEASIFINKDIFKFIDYYLKGRIPKELDTYKKALYGQRQYTDFYYKKYQIKDDIENYSNILIDDNISKIILGWNNGISDYSYLSLIKKNIYKFSNFFIKINKRKIYNKKRIFTGRFKQTYSRNTINFHRELYEKLFSIKCEIDRISRFSYFKELKDSLFSISPFGWGEICYRDFESFLYKCVLIKPNMEHIITWPNYYIENKTYLPMAWDDLDEELVNNIPENIEKYIHIANTGNINYLKYFNTNDENYFFEHFSNIINKIIK
tara:strand:+ start:552 stop:1598 length:1047 start_codon:yes stop_codon:yes gene_type:complete